MSYTAKNTFSNDSGDGAAEETLRLIASLPAPEGLEDRVHAGLLAAGRRGRVLAWPAAFTPASAWVRSAAAAAIVFVVAGGGWGIYSHVQPGQPARVIAMPHASASGGFSGAGAMRTPQTLNGPVVAHPATAQPPKAKVPAKVAARPETTPLHGAQPAAAVNKTTAPVVAPATK